jgi:hypothetical protein
MKEEKRYAQKLQHRELLESVQIVFGDEAFNSARVYLGYQSLK